MNDVNIWRLFSHKDCISTLKCHNCAELFYNYLYVWYVKQKLLFYIIEYEYENDNLKCIYIHEAKTLMDK